jgi:hypothetical protein
MENNFEIELKETRGEERDQLVHKRGQWQAPVNAEVKFRDR